MAFELTSAFVNGGLIPRKYTCDGEDISPPLQWENAPQGTKSFTIIAEDPDAPVGIWVHWLLYNVPCEMTALPQGIPPDAELPDGSKHGKNNWGRPGYGGPCPPGDTHRYFFKLYALDTALELPPGAGNEAIVQAMGGHILAQTSLMGLYSRQ